MSAPLTEQPVVWTHTGDAEFPYTTEVAGTRYTIRLNDFPAEPLYTLLSGEVELEDLEDWPSAWEMPAPPKALLELLVAKVEPRITGAARLAATSEVDPPVTTLALDHAEVVVDGARRLDLTTMRRRGTKAYTPYERRLPALDEAAAERILALAPVAGVAVSTFAQDDAHAVRVFDLRYAKAEILAVGQRPMRAAAIPPDGRSALVLDEEGRVLRYDLAKRGYPATTRARRPAPGKPACADVAPDGRVWLAASGRFVEVRKTCDEAALATIQLTPGEDVTCALFVQGGRGLLVGTTRGVVRRFELTHDRVGASEEARLAAVADAVDAALAQNRWERFSPRVEVYDRRTSETGRVTLYFVADHEEYHQAQSGSDWSTHDLCAGHATFDGETRVEAEVSRVDRRRYTEQQAEDHDGRAAFAAFRAEVARARSAATVVHGGEALKAAFDAYFADHGMAFPERCLHQDAGAFSAGGWDVKYRFGRDGKHHHVDVYASHRMTNDRVYRVREDGLVQVTGSSSEGVLPEEDREFEDDVARRFR